MKREGADRACDSQAVPSAGTGRLGGHRETGRHAGVDGAQGRDVWRVD